MWGSWRPKIQARSGVPAGCNGGLAARVGQANRSPGWGGGSTSQMARRAQRAGARARQKSTLQGSTRFRAECDSGGASSSHAPFSSHEAAVLRGLRGARGDGDGAGCWQRLFRFGSSRRSTLQGLARFRAECDSGRGIVLACPIFKPRSGGFAGIKRRARVMGRGRGVGRGCSGLGQAGG